MITELSFEEMQSIYGGAWTKIIINGEMKDVWIPDQPQP